MIRANGRSILKLSFAGGSRRQVMFISYRVEVQDRLTDLSPLEVSCFGRVRL
jgi:hypothetical protein